MDTALSTLPKKPFFFFGGGVVFATEGTITGFRFGLGFGFGLGRGLGFVLLRVATGTSRRI